MTIKGALLLTTIFVTVGLPISAAVAQGSNTTSNASSSTEEVIVTGSRVATSDLQSTSPVSVVSSDQIQTYGTVSVVDVIRDIPAASSASRSQTADLNGSGAQGINLYNLGTKRTLVLLDGQRYVPFEDYLGNSTQDISAIPSGMIQRVDVLRDGAAPTYGADAVAGVVNFILRDHFDGVETNASAGVSGRGDAPSYRMDATVGASSGRGSVMFSAEYQDQDQIHMSARGFSSPLISGLTATGPIIGSTTIPGGTVLKVNPSGSTTSIACYNVGSTVNLVGNCPHYDASVDQSLIAASKVVSFGGAATYDFTNDIHFKMVGFYSDRQSDQDLSAATLNTAGSIPPYTSGFTIPASSTNNPYGVPVDLQWRASQYGYSSNIARVDTYWLTSGFSGKLLDRFEWGVNATYSQNDTESVVTQNVNDVAFNTILNPSVCAADPLCSKVGSVPNITNFLTGVTPLTSAQQGYVFFNSLTQLVNSSEQEQATISGPLFSLPAGDVKVAVGVEHRHEISTVTPDADLIAGITSRQIFPTHGQYSTKEAFGEADIPLLSGLPFVQSLDVNLQGRYSDFSNFGEHTSYKAGLIYTVTSDILFRMDYGTSFRAPNNLELYGGGVGATASGADPCTSTGARAQNATVAANCAALGVPAAYQAPASLPVRSGGNPTLQPEYGKSLTVGTVITPSFLPGLTASINYFRFTINNQIGSSNLTTLLLGCYSDPTFLTRAANSSDICYNLNTRGPAGDLLRINRPQINLAQTTATSGVDFAVGYLLEQLPFVPGSLRADVTGEYLGSFNLQGVQNAGTYPSGLGDDTIYPRLQGNFLLNYTLDNFHLRWETKFIEGMRDGNPSGFPAVNYLNYSGTPNYFLDNIYASVDLGDDLTVGAGINNLLDQQPPYAFDSTHNTLYAYDQLGRYFFGTISKKF